MDAISLWQPWATLTVVRDPANAGLPPKEWETRPYAPPRKTLRQRIGLASTASVPGEIRRSLIVRGRFRQPYAAVLERCGVSVLDPWAPRYLERVEAHEIPLLNGRLLGSAIVLHHIETEHAGPWISADKAAHHARDRMFAVATELALGDYTPGRVTWQLYAARRLRPSLECSGMQRVWTLPPDLERAVLRSVARTAPAIAPVLAGQ